MEDGRWKMGTEPHLQTLLVREWEFGSEFAHALADFGQRIKVLEVKEHFGDHVGNVGHLRLFHAPGSYRGGAQADATGLKGGPGFEGDGVFVDGDAGLVQDG